jgi:molybdate transport system ATP-binding protein
MGHAMSLSLDLDVPRRDFRLQLRLTTPSTGITALFGRSGSGKTTLLRCIAGLERAARATVRFNDEIWQDATQFVPTHRRRLGFVFQEASLFPHLNVKANLEYGLRRVPAAQRLIKLDDAVSLLSLTHMLERQPHQLSGGQQQRVALARALLASPQLLLMDEPLSNLDIASRNDVLPHLERLHDQLSIPIVYVSHEVNEVMRVADHVALLESGNLVAFGDIQDMLTRPDLPLAHLDQAGSGLEGVIAEHDSRFHLSYVDVPGGRLAISLRSVPLGRPVRILVEARDVSLALSPPQHSSITNILPGRVLDVSEDRDPAQRLIRVDVGGKPLMARITARSVQQLKIAPGVPLYAQIKSIALMD